MSTHMIYFLGEKKKHRNTFLVEKKKKHLNWRCELLKYLFFSNFSMKWHFVGSC